MPVKRKVPARSQPAAKPRKGNTLSLEQAHRLIDLMEERGLEEFEFEGGGVRIRIRRRGQAAVPPPVFESVLPGNHAGGPVPGMGSAAASEMPGDAGAREDVHVVKSPIVGTFYAAPRPDAPPFVRLGDPVEMGQVLCIIEAMKLMNEIESDVAGEIVRVYVENGQPVEYGENLFAIRPSRKK